MIAHIFPGRPQGTCTPPPSKSVAHRALACAALAAGASGIQNIGTSQDTLATLGAVQALGATVCGGAAGTTTVAGVGALPLPVAALGKAVDCGACAATLRFFIPLAALAPGKTVFCGAPALFARPLEPYREIFEQQGLPFLLQQSHLTVGGPLCPGEFYLPGNLSSQFTSGLLLALPLLSKDSHIHIVPPVESRGYIELTRSVQAQFGVYSRWEGESTLYVPGCQRYLATNFMVAADVSSAAVVLVLGALCGDVQVAGVNSHSLQPDVYILQLLRQCGVSLRWQGGYVQPVGRQGLRLPGAVSLAQCPDLGPILCTLGLFSASGATLTDAGRLRHKESDRLAALQQEFATLGTPITVRQDTIYIEGGRPLRQNTRLCAHNDHRIAMALAVAAIAGGVGVQIVGAECVDKSWPNFWQALQALQIEVTLE